MFESRGSKKGYIPFSRPAIGDDEIREVVATLRSGWISTGIKAKEFEKEFASYIGAPYTVAINSCTAGLHLALVALGIGPGDEVITSTYTFAATAEVIIQVGAKPVLVDVEKDTLNLDPLLVKKAITSRTRAIIPVHFAGHPCEMKAILAIAGKYGIKVIEDAAHALGSEYYGKKVGTLSDITVFSFYATKNLTTAEGGMVALKNKKISKKISILSLHGISQDAWKRYSQSGSWYYEILDAGYKYNLTDLAAAIGLVQLKRFNTFQSIRAKYAGMYGDSFRNVPQLTLPVVREGIIHAWHLYCVRLGLEELKIDRAEFIRKLQADGIGASVHFIPLHLHPYYRRRYGFKRGDFPVAEEAYERIISLPLYPSMKENEIKRVIRSVQRILSKRGRRWE